MEHLASFGTGARVNVFEGGRFSRLLEVENKTLLTEVQSAGTVEAPRLDVTVHGEEITDQTLEYVRGTLAWVLGGDTPLQEFYAAARRDPVLAPLVKQLYGLKISQTPSGSWNATITIAMPPMVLKPIRSPMMGSSPMRSSTKKIGINRVIAGKP